MARTVQAVDTEYPRSGGKCRRKTSLASGKGLATVPPPGRKASARVPLFSGVRYAFSGRRGAPPPPGL